MNVYSDSPTGEQFCVRYRVLGREGEGHYWSYVYNDEESAREVLASFEADAGLTDVGLLVRTVTPWRRVPVALATACPHGYLIGEHCGICGSGVRG